MVFGRIGKGAVRMVDSEGESVDGETGLRWTEGASAARHFDRCGIARRVAARTRRKRSGDRRRLLCQRHASRRPGSPSRSPRPSPRPSPFPSPCPSPNLQASRVAAHKKKPGKKTEKRPCKPRHYKVKELAEALCIDGGSERRVGSLAVEKLSALGEGLIVDADWMTPSDQIDVCWAFFFDTSSADYR